jgi:hypothetical protein
MVHFDIVVLPSDVSVKCKLEREMVQAAGFVGCTISVIEYLE